ADRTFSASLILPACILIFSLKATPTTDISTLSLHDALPISSTIPVFSVSSSITFSSRKRKPSSPSNSNTQAISAPVRRSISVSRSEEHTSELQSRENLVCRLLLEKKKTHIKQTNTITDMRHR